MSQKNICRFHTTQFLFRYYLERCLSYSAWWTLPLVHGDQVDIAGVKAKKACEKIENKKKKQTEKIGASKDTAEIQMQC